MSAYSCQTTARTATTRSSSSSSTSTSTSSTSFVIRSAQSKRIRRKGRSRNIGMETKSSSPSSSSSSNAEQLTKESDVSEETEAMKKFLDSLKYDQNGLVAAIAQDVDTGAILMQGFATRVAVQYTLEHRKACFFSRSRKQLWCKGESSGNFISVDSVHVDCDRDSLIYLGVPSGPTCHTGAHTCYYKRVDGEDGLVGAAMTDGRHKAEEALTTLYELEATIEERKREHVKEGSKPSWTRRLLEDPALLCSKIREEAGELCETYEKNEGKERAASECADVLYHAMVLLNVQGVEIADVMEVLRNRFGVSGVEEKAKRSPKTKLIDPTTTLKK
jgi:phosphoribosyl-AMP cyclohydrolase / phosphoribosyl-ATP pyrophosphohydrolase